MKGYYQDNLSNELIVDNFAGGGGASVGIELATGRPVDIAINHSEDAIAMHRVNHTHTTHYKEDVFNIVPEEITCGRKVGLAWFSPDCKHFSKAKGDKPVEKKIRGLSWVILRWAMSKVSPRVIIMENVEEIMTWCPLKEVNGKLRPDPNRLGETFKGFLAMLSEGISKNHPAYLEACEFLNIDPNSYEGERLSSGIGYKYNYKVFRACDYGSPTLRKRFYLIARNDGQPIVFPKPTHGEGMKPYKTAFDCIDWSIPCTSIFDRKKELVVNTKKRIARGIDKFVIKNSSPFIMQVNYDNIPQSINRPLSTITAVGHHYIVNPCIVPIGYGENKGQKSRVQNIDNPLATVVGSNKHSLIAPFLTKYFSGEYQVGAMIDTPVPTVTSIDHTALVESHLCVFRKNMDCKQIDYPLSTITASGHFAKIDTYLEKVDGTQNLRKWNSVRKLLNNYAGYSIKDNELLIFEINNVKYFISDIGMRMLTARELMLAQGFPSDYIIDIESYIGKKYSNAKQIARIGNAVCPQVATMLVRANLPDLATKKDLKTVRDFEKNLAYC